MCGIFAVISSREVSSLLIDGLRKGHIKNRGAGKQKQQLLMFTATRKLHIVRLPLRNT